MADLMDPRGDIKLQNDKKTLLMQPYFYQATTQGEKPETPLKVFSNFSRWAVTLIDTTADRKAVTHNISIHRSNRMEYDELSGALTDGIAMELPYRYGQVKQTAESSPAYTVTLFTAPFKGMTPAAALLENGANREKLLQMYKQLQENMEKYKRNAEQMAAIKEAITLFDKGELSGDQASANVVTLYESGPKPNVYKSENGLSPVTELNVKLYHGEKFPFEIEVQNYKAPVNERETGAINAVKSQAVDFVSHTYRVSLSDMRGIVKEMERAVNAFYYTHYLSCEKEAIAEEKRQRDRAGSTVPPDRNWDTR